VFKEEKEYDKEIGRVVYEIAPIIWVTAVDPDYRRKGVGSKVLNKTIRKLRDEGHAFAYTFLKPDDTRAIKFYEKAGFELKEDKKPYILCLNEDWTRDNKHNMKWEA